MNYMAGRRRRHSGAALFAVVLLSLTITSPAAPLRFAGESVRADAVDAAADTVAAVLRQRLARPEVTGLLSPELVSRYYARRGYAPAWSREGGVSAPAEALMAALRAVEEQGLRPQDYRLEQIEESSRRLRATPRGEALDAEERATLDLLLSDAFLTLGSHLVNGRIDPNRIHIGWSLPPRHVDVVAALDRALRDGQMGAAMNRLAPSTPEYVALRGALRRYRDIATQGWPVLPSGPTLRQGDRGDAVRLLRARLAAEIQVPRADSPAVFDAALAEAVREFQRTRGLHDDAAVGPDTRAALNVAVGSRVEQIEFSLERLRWLPGDLGRRHIRVSIPAFELAVVDEGRTTLTMRVVGGRPDWRTPIFSARMTSVVLSPYWNIPPSIAEAEVLPRERRDPGYMARNGIRWVRDGSGSRLRQDPGPLNPLGGVKFMFPNAYNVYLHDTPTKQLFAEPERAYSHGCMRVEKPLELAEYVLRDLGWEREEIGAAMVAGKERTVVLQDPISVHVLYATAWVDAAGRVHFRDDLYGHDQRLTAALDGGYGRVSERVSGGCVLAAR